MILAIDVGNTNVVIGSVEGKKINFMERVSTDASRTELEYMVSLKAVLDIYQIKPEDIDGVIVSSVVPPITGIMVSAMKKLVGKEAMVVGPGIKTGLNIRTDDPAEVGADLIVDAVAGIQDYGAPLLIIDMGTATTISVIDKNKTYLGGIIMPGARISQDALTQRTAQLPKISIEAPKKAISSNTIDCMKAGIVFGQAGALDGLIDCMEKELGYPTTIVATGGLSERIVPYCRHEIICDNELTVRGLQYLYEKNAK